MAYSTCKTCGSPYEWHWEDAFSKFGFGDGDGQVETGTVADALEAMGYHVTLFEWGLHNTVIDSIIKDGVERIPGEHSAYVFGYDCPRDYLPDDLIARLDQHFPAI